MAAATVRVKVLTRKGRWYLKHEMQMMSDTVTVSSEVVVKSR